MVTTYAGDNDGQRLEATKKYVQDFVERYTDMGLEKIDAVDVDYEQILGAAQSVPFLAERKLVVIRQGSLNKEFVEKFEQFLDSVLESTEVLITEGKLDKRTGYYRLLKSKTNFTEFAVLDSNGLVKYAVEYANELGAKLSTSDARYLIERTAPNQLSLKHDIDKLALYKPTINREAIDLLTELSPQSTTFELIEAAFRGDHKKTESLYADQLAQGMEPRQIIWLLAWQLHMVAVAKAGRAMSSADIARDLNTKTYPVDKARALASRISAPTLKRMISDLRELDVRSKSEGILLDDALQYYLLTLAQ